MYMKVLAQRGKETLYAIDSAYMYIRIVPWLPLPMDAIGGVYHTRLPIEQQMLLYNI
jgi:hypothetical protein